MLPRPRQAAFALAVMALLAVPASGAAPPLVRTLTPGAAPFNGLQIALADFRGDGHVAAVVQSDDGRVLVVDPASGTLLATLRPGNAGCTSTCYSFEGISGPINAPVVADLDRDGRLDLILSNTAAVVARYTFDPAASSATHFAFTKLWEHRYNQYQSFTTMDATPAVADLDGNGQLDLVVVTEENGLFAVRPDGTTLWASSRHGGHAGASVADLDRDGKPDVVVATDDGLVQALVAKTGAVRWTFDARAFVRPASIPMAPTLADVTGDGKPDVLFAARDAHDARTFTNDHAAFFALDSWGHRLWTFQPSWGAPLSHTRPVVVRVAGAPAILEGDWNTIGHDPGRFEKVGPGHVFLLDAKGKEVWRRDLAAAQSNKDFAVADVVGDGTQQVIVSGTKDGHAGFWLFDVAHGTPKGFLQSSTPTRSGVAVGDLFGDGRFAMVAATQAGSSAQLQVWHGSQTLSTAFPGWGATVAVAAHASTTFTATFTPRSVGNDWWVETGVTGSQAIAKVEARLDGGAWTALPKDSWGTYADSLHAPNGTQVVFRATATGGATATSGVIVWT